MSARIAKLVLASGLPAHLKPVAVTLALFGDEQGESIFPSVGRVAYLLSTSPSTVKRALRDLRTCGALQVKSSLNKDGQPAGGRGRTTRYSLNVAALPARAGYLPPSQQNSAASDTLSAGETVSPETPFPPERPERVAFESERVSREPERVSPETVKGVTSDTRSFSDRLEDRKVDRRADARVVSFCPENGNGNGNGQERQEEKPKPLPPRPLEELIEQVANTHPKLAQAWRKDRERRTARKGA